MAVYQLTLFVFLSVLVRSSTSEITSNTSYDPHHHIFARKGVLKTSTEVKGVLSTPRYMMTLYEEAHNQKHHDQQDFVDTMKAIEVEQVILWKGNRGSLTFKVDGDTIPKEEHFHSAELVLTPKHHKTNSLRIGVFCKENTTAQAVELELTNPQYFNSTVDVLKFDVSQVLSKWAASGQNNTVKEIEIVVECMDDKVRQRHPKIGHTFYRSGSRRPLIILYTSTKIPDTFFGYIRRNLPEVAEQLYSTLVQRLPRQKPAVKTFRKRRSTGRCKLRRYYLSFVKALRRNYVIQPPGFWANYCDGVCTVPVNSNRMHTVLMAIAASFDRGKSLIGPKCVADKYEDVQLLYINEENKIILKMFKDMKAKSCSCV